MISKRQERDSIYSDVCSGKKPLRVPIMSDMLIEGALEGLGYSIKRDLYSPRKCFEAADKMAELFDSDDLPVTPYNQAIVFRYIGQRFMVQGADGFFQHPNLSPMEFDEYPKLIEDALGFIVRDLHPRVFDTVDEDPVAGQLRVKIARDYNSSLYAGMYDKLAEKHERTTIFKTCTLMWAPFDMIADYIRSFSTILTDFRRKPQWVIDACEAVLEIEKKQIDAIGAPSDGVINTIKIPLHMPPFMQGKDVQRFYWPTFKALIEYIEQKGFLANCYVEENWDPHLDFFSDLPGRVMLNFENSSHKLITEKVPVRHIYTHGYNAAVLRLGTKKECEDEAKRTIDNLAGAGNYIFCPNKGLIRGTDYKTENVQAMIECVKDYGRY